MKTVSNPRPNNGKAMLPNILFLKISESPNVKQHANQNNIGRHHLSKQNLRNFLICFKLVVCRPTIAGITDICASYIASIKLFHFA